MSAAVLYDDDADQAAAAFDAGRFAFEESTGLGTYEGLSDAGRCLAPILQTLGWRGEARHAIEALPHFVEKIDLGGLRATLANLDYETVPLKIRLHNLRPDHLPCILRYPDNQLVVMVERLGGKLIAFNAATNKCEVIDPDATPVEVLIVRAAENRAGLQSNAQQGWLNSVFTTFLPLTKKLLLLTLAVNILALATPFFIMGVYNRVIGTSSTQTLVFLVLGLLIAFAIEFCVRTMRSDGLSYLGARLDYLLNVSLFSHLLSLPAYALERAPVGPQISRLRQVESLREAFTGPLAGAFLDIPFIVLFTTAIALLGGIVGLVPIAMVAAYLLMAGLFIRRLRKVTSELSEAKAQKQNFLIELVANQRQIKSLHAEDTWMRRYRGMSSRAALAHRAYAQLILRLQINSQMVLALSSIATLSLATYQVIAGAMGLGALLAVMALFWRLSSPIQNAFLGLSRLEQIITNVKQINHLMSLKTEIGSERSRSFYRSFSGGISIQRVSFRYDAQAEPALRGVSLNIRPGEVVAITGPGGSGKSTLIELLMGLYRPQVGTILIDDVDLRQIDPRELRHAVAYVPQHTSLFHGTIAQNMRLAAPGADKSSLNGAIMDAGLLNYILAQEEGLETRLTELSQKRMTQGAQQQLGLARAYAKSAPIYLFDEPAANLDHAGDEAFIRKLQSLSGRATVIMTTQRPSHMRAADRLLYFEEGRLLADGPPEEIMAQIGLAGPRKDPEPAHV